MPTTNPALARMLLDRLASSPIRFALLHRADDLIDGTLRSDVDLVVSGPPAEALPTLTDVASDVGLHLVCTCHYDVGGCSTFWATADASDGVHLDMSHDLSGDGRLGLRTGPLLDAACTDGRWAVVHPDDGLLYLLRKRHWKQDGQRLDALRSSLSATERQRLKSRAEELFRNGMVPLARELIDGALPRRGPTLSSPTRQSLRLLHRMQEPCGFWVEFSGPERDAVARGVERRFSRFLVRTTTTPRARPLLTPSWYLRSIAPVRFRAGLVASTTRHAGRWPLPDLSIAAPVDEREAAVAVVAAMASRHGAPRGQAPGRRVEGRG